MKIISLIYLFILIQSCKSPVNANKFCDYKSIGYKLELARRISVNDNSAYCQFSARNLVGQGTSSGTATGTNQTSTNITSDFASLTSLAPILIAKDRILSFTNTEEMGNVCQVKLNTSVISPTVTLSTDKKTISLTPPLTGWTLDVENIITLQLQNCKTASGIDVQFTGAGLSLYIAEKVIYVDSVSGSDTNAGTTTAPMKSILAALTSASTGCTDRCAIGVKGGTYLINGSITIPKNTSIFGGFDPSDWTKRRADKTLLSPYDTILTDSSSSVTATNNADPYSTLKYVNYTGEKSKTVLDGILVNGPVSATTGTYIGVIGSVGLQASAGFIIRNTITNDLTSSNTVISAGFSSINNSGSINLTNSAFFGSTFIATATTRLGVVYSISAPSSSISITDSLINAGTSALHNVGFYMANTNNGTISLSKNTIIAGNSGQNSVGVQANFATPNGMKISENTITTGTSGAISNGIECSAGTGLVADKNIITVGTGTSGSGGILTSSSISAPVFSNNTITGGSCSNVSCVSASVLVSNPTNTSITDNILSLGSCTGATCFTAGLHFNSVGTHTISGNVINATGSCNTNNCSAAGIYNVNTTGVNTFNISNNTIKSGSCSGTSCRTVGVGNVLQVSSSGIHNWTLTNNNISSGTCNGLSCSASGFFTNDHHANGSDFSFNNNIISSGDCTGASCKTFGFSSTAISNRTASVSLIGNTISAGNTLSGVGTESTGFNLTYNNATVFMDNNTITSGTANTTWGANISFLVGITVTNNTITVGTSASTQIGYRQANATLTLTGNTISSGIPSGTTTSRIAFNLENASGTPSIQRNTFKNESGTGVPIAANIAWNGALQFCSNVLIGGSGTHPISIATLNLAVLLNSGARFMGNTIIGPTNTGAGTANPVLFTTTGAHTNLKLDQNLFVGNSPATNCVNEAVAGISYATLVKNNFSSCSTTFYKRFGVADFNQFCSGNFGQSGMCATLLMGVSSTANEVQTPTFTNFAGGDFHLITPTPAAVLNGMLTGDITPFNAACGNSFDRDGATRTNGTALGAYK